MDLITQQDQLQRQAQEVLDDLDLINLLKEYGEPEVVGSVSLGLMTWRDIDIEIVVEELDKEKVAEVIKKLVLRTQYRIDFSFSDNIARFNNSNPNSPHSLYLRIKYFGKDIPPIEMQGANSLVWKIDLHFLLKENARTKDKTNEIRSKLTEEKRKIILEIKSKVTAHPSYRKEIFSKDIYDAVLDKGVTNIDEFKDYLNERGASLD